MPIVSAAQCNDEVAHLAWSVPQRVHRSLGFRIVSVQLDAAHNNAKLRRRSWVDFPMFVGRCCRTVLTQAQRLCRSWVFWCATLAALATNLPAALAKCDGVTAATQQDANARLAKTVAELQSVLPEARNQNATRALQERGLAEIEAIQCIREAQAPAEMVTRGPSIATRFVQVPVLFVTDRRRISAPDGEHRFFNGQRDPQTWLGRVQVRLPAEAYSGGPVPVGTALTAETDAREGVVVAQPEMLTRETFKETIRRYRESLPTGTPSRLLLFVHGFNVTYQDAVSASARLAWGMRINVLPVAVSWPSQGQTVRYFQDEEAIPPSAERLRAEFQWLLSEVDSDEVILVAHSMGARLTVRILSDLQLQNVSVNKLTRLILAAADLGEEETKELWRRLQDLPSKGWTSYTSSNDFALMCSRFIHGLPRIGDSVERVFTLAGMETVDASSVAPLLRGYGHSYVFDNPGMKVDLRRSIALGLNPVQRGLTEGNRPPARFWELKN